MRETIIHNAQLLYFAGQILSRMAAIRVERTAMRKYEPEILMGLILSLALLLVHPPGGAAAAVPNVPPAVLASAAERAVSFDRLHIVRVAQGEEVQLLTMREYLIGVVMSEMPMSFEPEALRAQAIASRTYALHCRKHAGADVCDDGNCCQCRADEETLRIRFGAEYDVFQQKAARVVDSTDGEVLTFGGELIDATFFACSGGRTEDASEVWGAGQPYLRSVESPGEESARSYHSRAEFSPGKFAEIVRSLAPEAVLEGDPAAWIGAEDRTAGDGVRTLELGGAALTGSQLRAAFGLASTRFTLQWDGSSFCFEVYGAGHRVGLSQCGAQAMARNGATAEQILKTYYTGVEISHR